MAKKTFLTLLSFNNGSTHTALKTQLLIRSLEQIDSPLTFLDLWFGTTGLACFFFVCVHMSHTAAAPARLRVLCGCVSLFFVG